MAKQKPLTEVASEGEFTGFTIQDGMIHGPKDSLTNYFIGTDGMTIYGPTNAGKFKINSQGQVTLWEESTGYYLVDFNGHKRIHGPNKTMPWTQEVKPYSGKQS